MAAICASNARWRPIGGTKAACCALHAAINGICRSPLEDFVTTTTTTIRQSEKHKKASSSIHGIPRCCWLHASRRRHVCCTHRQAQQSLIKTPTTEHVINPDMFRVFSWPSATPAAPSVSGSDVGGPPPRARQDFVVRNGSKGPHGALANLSNAPDSADDTADNSRSKAARACKEGTTVLFQQRDFELQIKSPKQHRAVVNPFRL